MKILITGTAGFIGSNLAKKLVKEKHSVYGVDNLSHGYLRNIKSLERNSKFKFILGDILNPYILDKIKADVIVHLASQKIPRYTTALRTLDENYIMLKNIVTKCLKDNIKIVFASTSDVYGKNTNIPFNESSDLVLGPTVFKRWSYSISKIYGEQYIIANHDEFGLNYTITRFFGSYGPNQNLTWWGGPQSVFINNAFKKINLEIHGNGMQTRVFTFIDDTIEGLYQCVTNPNGDNNIFNIASFPDEEITIKDLGILIWKLINKDIIKPKIRYIPYRNFGRYEDVFRRVPDISKLKNYFSFKPKFRLKQGLIRTINWQKNYID